VKFIQKCSYMRANNISKFTCSIQKELQNCIPALRKQLTRVHLFLWDCNYLVGCGPYERLSNREVASSKPSSEQLLEVSTSTASLRCCSSSCKSCGDASIPERDRSSAVSRCCCNWTAKELCNSRLSQSRMRTPSE